MMFIDYDNVDRAVRQQGVEGVIRAVLEQVPEHALPAGTRVATRFYGGWYDQHQLSSSAQALTRDIDNNFPSILALPTLGRGRTVPVSAELALALSISPTAELMNTYRIRSAPPSLRAQSYPFAGCALGGSGCPLLGTYQLVRKRRCPDPKCSVRLKDVITRPEQKLVDTMLTADLVYVATLWPSTVIVASNDDDLWPAIHTAVNLGTTVHHVHPKGGRSTPDIYASTVDDNYFQYSF